MAKPAPLTRPELIRRQAYELLSIADAYEEPSRSIVRADGLIARLEHVASATRAIGRGRSVSL